MLEVLRDGDKALIAAPSGPLCPATAPALGRRIHNVIEAGEHRLIVDLRGVTLLSAAGVGEIAGGIRHVEQVGGTLVIRNARGLPRKVIDVVGLDAYLESPSFC